MTFILLFLRLSVVMSNESRGLASADKKPARIITGTEHPQKRKRKREQEKKIIIPERKRNQL